MNYERYEDLTVRNSYKEYEFVGVGPKGDIPKIIQFTSIGNRGVNLAFGNKRHDGRIDDKARNDNKDRNKILATVVWVLRTFLKEYPDKLVFLAGSCPARTRLYRMAITINYEELAVEFKIFGVQRENRYVLVVPFVKSVNYSGFLVQHRKLNFII